VTLDAQGAPANWAVGVDWQVAGPPLPSSSFGAHVSRRIVSGNEWGLRVEASGLSVAKYGRSRSCDSSALTCDTREIGQSGELEGVFTFGAPENAASAWPYWIAGAGAYVTRWAAGFYRPSSQAATKSADGMGPSGVAVEGGLGWRMPVNNGRVSMDFLLRRYFQLMRPNRLGFDTRVTWAW
jgi:hypothetical protein